MLQIKNTLGGGKPEGLYAWKKSEIGSELKVLNESVSSLPYNFYRSSAVVLNGEIHILGSSSSGNETKHYKWDGTSWTSVSILPYNFYRGSAVVLNGEIHILGSGDSSNLTKHYKWDGSSWTSISSLPYDFYDGSAVVFDNEIHILGGGGNGFSHYKFDGSSWTSVSTLPYSFYNGSAVVLNNEIHILGSSSSSSYYKAHYKWDGSSWTSVSTLPYNFYNGSAVVYNGKIHILGSGISSISTYHYKWEDNSWESVDTLPYSLDDGPAVIYNNGIHILGSYNSSYQTAHYLVYGYVTVYTFLDYIVSDKETAYPDGGEKGGYWYERVSDGLTPEMFGYTKMAIDKYTPTMDSYTNTLKVNHSLGEIPKRIFILVDMNDFQEDDSSNYLVFADIALNPNKKYMSSISRSSTFNMANYPWCGGYSEGAVSTSYNTSWNITSKLFIFNTSGSFKYKAGTEYTIISMA